MTELSTNIRANAVLGALLAVGLVAGGFALGWQIKATRLADRYVTVRGLVERKVKSDLAVWSVVFKQADDDLATAYARTDADRRTILQFLSDQGIGPGQIETGMIRVVDLQAREYGSGTRPLRRYVVQQTLIVRTSQVDQVAAAAQKTMQLVQKGIVLDSESGPGLRYQFTGLNGIKPDMITEATRNARAAAERFAADSGSKVGSIRQANQGVFSILPANPAGADGEGPDGGSGGADASILKTVRVVTTVEYYLEK